MSSLSVGRQQLALTLRWRPEWRVATLAAVAWIVLLSGIGRHSAELGTQHATLGALAAWTLMVVAMMVPVTLPAVRHVALNSMRRRQQRAVAVYVTVYVGVWVLFGLSAIGLVHLLVAHAAVSEQALLAATLVLAGGWQLTRAKRRALYACGRTVPLPPRGRRADAGCARFAMLQSWRCIQSCWAIMLVMAVIGHASLVWMIALMVLVVAEELTVRGRRLTRPAAGVLLAAAAAVALGGVGV